MKKAIVVGSGAGGCAAAGKLSEHFDVLVVEEGGTFEPFRYSLAALEPLRRTGAFFDERMISLIFPQMRIVKAREGLVHVNGRCLGGSTTLATGNALRCDQPLAEIGINLDEEFDELGKAVPITQDHHARWSGLTVLLYEIFDELGFDPQVTPKFLHDAKRCRACGRCVLGCRFGAKWTADALLEGKERIRILPNTAVKRVLVSDGRACGVETKNRNGSEILESDLVVLAAGGLGTPAILNASGFETSPTLFTDPVICVATPWEDARLQSQLPMPFVSQRDGHILSPYFDWLSFFFNKQWRKPASGIMSIMVKYADSSLGSFDGKHMSKPVSAQDNATIKRSVEEAAQVLERMGANRTSMFLGTLNAGHPGGCLPLTAAEAQTMHHSHLPENLYVADASLLPHALGNPPILTVMALAMHVARACIRTHALG